MPDRQRGFSGRANDSDAGAAEDRLRASEEKYRRLVEEINDVIVTVDDSGVVTYISPAVEAVGGFVPSEIIGRSFADFILPEDHPSVMADFQRSLSGRSAPMEYRVRTRSGEVRWVRSFAHPVREEGRIAGLRGVLTDVTSRKNAELALQRERDRFQQYLDIANVMLLALDERGDVTLINRKGCRILGYEEKEILGRNWFAACMPPEFRAQVENVFAKLMAGDIELVESYENPVLTRSGELRLVAFHNALLRDESGRVVGTLSSGNDVTEQRHLEESLRQAQKMEALGRLAGGIAHDFNNELLVVEGYSSVLLRQLEGREPYSTAVAEIKKAAEHGATLTRQLLAFSRRQVLTPTFVDLNESLNALERMLSRLIGEHVALRVFRGPRLGCVRVDAGQIEQVIINLAANARDAMPEGGTLKIETENVEVDEAQAARHPDLTPGSFVVLSMSDTGIGMDGETASHVFEPFFSMRGAAQATGLGLATVHGIVKQHGGNVSVESEPGRGTTFRIYLPRVDAPAAEARGQSGDVSSPRTLRTILLVEDEDAVRRLLRTVLEDRGYRVLEAHDGPSALALAGRWDAPIDLVVTDMVMPGMSGRALAEQLMRERPGLKAVCTSGYLGDDTTGEDLARAGIEFLQKPFAEAEILETVRRVLEEEESGRENA